MTDIFGDDREAVFERLGAEPAFEAPVTETAPPFAAEPEEAPVAEEPAPVVTYDATPPLVIIPLRHPLVIDGARFRKIELRDPIFSDVASVLAGKMTEHELHANMAGVSVAALRALKWSDAEAVSAAARHIAPEFA